jgi:hypothetical protein
MLLHVVNTGVKATFEVIHIDTEPPLAAAATRPVAALGASSLVQSVQSAESILTAGLSSFAASVGKIFYTLGYRCLIAYC